MAPMDSFDDLIDAVVDEPVHVTRGFSKLSSADASDGYSDGEGSSSSYSLRHFGEVEKEPSSCSSSTSIAVDRATGSHYQAELHTPLSAPAAGGSGKMTPSSSWRSSGTTNEPGSPPPTNAVVDEALGPRAVPPMPTSDIAAPDSNTASNVGVGMESTDKTLKRYDSLVPVAEDRKGHTVYKFGKLVSLNDYSIGRVIGKGGFAEVKLGTKGDVKYAIKVIDIDVVMKKFMLGARAKGAALTEQMGRVTAEIEIMKTLRHPHLVQLFEVLRDDKYIYLIMEFMEGGPIMSYNSATHRFRCNVPRALLGNARGEMSEEWACREFSSLISGLRYLHERHIAHRDLKPENLLIDSRGVLKVSDFGVSRHFVEERKKDKISLKQLAKSQSRGKVTNTEGTWVFYSPEMCQETASTYSAYMADIWAAGVCLWVFVFNALPFFHPEVRALFRDIRERDPCETMPHSISPELNDLFRKVLAKDVDARLSIDDIEKHPWMVKEVHVPLSTADSVLEEGDEDAEESDSESDSFSKGFSTNFTEAFCTMASTVYQHNGAAGSSSKNVLGALGTKGMAIRPGVNNMNKLNNPNSGGASSLASLGTTGEIVEEETQGSDAGAEDTDSSYGSEVNDNYTSEWSSMSPKADSASLPSLSPFMGSFEELGGHVPAVGVHINEDSEKRSHSDCNLSSRDKGGGVLSTEAVELLLDETESPDEPEKDIVGELNQPKPAACCIIS